MSTEQNMIGKSVLDYWQILVSGVLIIVGYVKMGGRVDNNMAKIQDTTDSQEKAETKLTDHDVRIAVIESNIDGIRQASKSHAESVGKIFELLRKKD
ncbi:MAG: hypothetical protein HN641_13700 [Candidatus Marinimicrobia bacterium]|jgi:hypothetical protein|uniref:Uncharacterized protein n=1 Tax=uncultured marine virus TaxID=186617 RepID=A0A0F7L6F6_9VIRU|nr:hypothetical protein [uncultured marine virus]MBT7884877.1 hypothetical protein [Candidatus Neomarinimicrobiota bacterium]